LMDVISCEATGAVKGSHGRPTDDPFQGPLLISDRVTRPFEPIVQAGSLPSHQVFNVILDALFEPRHIRAGSDGD
jgi:hypothetical protein